MTSWQGAGGRGIVRTLIDRRQAPPRRVPGWLVPGVLCASYLGAVIVLISTWLLGWIRVDQAVGPFMAAYAATGTVLAIRAALHRNLDARIRRGWALMAVAFAFLFASCMVFAGTEGAAFPSPGDALRLMFVPILLAGILLIPPRRGAAGDGRKLALDIGIVVSGGAMLLWYLVLGAVLADQGRQPGLVTAASAAYPIGDLALIFGAANIMLRTASPMTRRPLLLLAAAAGAFVVGDVYLGYQGAHNLAGKYLVWQFVCWMTAHFLVALAAADQCRQANRPHQETTDEPRLRPVPRLPYAAVAIGYVLLLVVASGLPLYPYAGLIVGAVAMTVLVVTRQVVALRENHTLVVTDSLTGLANRALLRHDLTRAIDRSQRTGEPVAVLLIDLNGFKQINDTLGHEAGDEMLVAFARLLERHVRRTDTVARLGGDEFAIVLHADDPALNAPLVAQRITDATEEPVLIAGKALRPSASIGVAISGPDRCTVNELLHDADTAMYRVKRQRSGGSAGRRTGDLAAAG